MFNKGDKVYLSSGFVSNTFNKCNSKPAVKYYGWIIDEFNHRVFIHTWTWATIIRIEGHRCDLLVKDGGYQVIIYNVHIDALSTVDDFIKLWEDEEC